MTTAKIIGAWIIGSVLLLIGSWIMSNLEKTIGVSDASFIFAIIVALVFFLGAGLCWISTAVATKH